jgi:hypothetical protein
VGIWCLLQRVLVEVIGRLRVVVGLRGVVVVVDGKPAEG